MRSNECHSSYWQISDWFQIFWTMIGSSSKVSHQIWHGCHTSVDSGDLSQAPPKQSFLHRLIAQRLRQFVLKFWATFEEYKGSFKANTWGLWKIGIFPPISRFILKRYKVQPLQCKMNRNLYLIYRMVAFPMTLCGP